MQFSHRRRLGIPRKNRSAALAEEGRRRPWGGGMAFSRGMAVPLAATRSMVSCDACFGTRPLAPAHTGSPQTRQPGPPQQLSRVRPKPNPFRMGMLRYGGLWALRTLRIAGTFPRLRQSRSTAGGYQRSGGVACLRNWPGVMPSSRLKTTLMYSGCSKPESSAIR